MPAALGPALAEVRKRGCTTVPGLFDRDWCARAVDELAGIYGGGAVELVLDDEGADVRLWGAQRTSSAATGFAHHPELLAGARRYLRTPAEPMTTMVGHLRAVPGNRGSGGGWHRDSAFTPQFKAILYLTDVGSENGPFQYVPGSHRLPSVLRSLEIESRRGITRFEDHPFEGETLVGEAGTVVLADTRGLHRGAPIEAGERWAMTNYYFPRHRRPEFEHDFADVAGVLAS